MTLFLEEIPTKSKENDSFYVIVGKLLDDELISKIIKQKNIIKTLKNRFIV